MKAFILAAGIGKRLRPLTDDKPKAMVTILEKPLIFHLINKLREEGISEVLVNTHYLSDQLISYLRSRDFGLPVKISDESDKLLDTGGAIKKALAEFSDDFLVYNCDVISNIDLGKFIRFHKEKGGLASLAVRKRNSSRYFLFDQHRKLRGWKNKKSGEEILHTDNSIDLTEFAFSGISIINPRIAEFMPAENVFSIVKAYLQACRSEDIYAYIHDDDFWLDAGRLEDIHKASNYYSDNY